MKHKGSIRPHALLTLQASSAEELMTPNPISVRDTATIRETAALLTDRRIGAAPVIDAAGHPVGVVSRSDIVRYEREHVEYLPPPEGEEIAEARRAAAGFQVERVDATTVESIMTPFVFSVPLRTSTDAVVKEMLQRGIHRLFVVDDGGVLVGVVSTVDVLRRLSAECGRPARFETVQSGSGGGG